LTKLLLLDSLLQENYRRLGQRRDIMPRGE